MVDRPVRCFGHLLPLTCGRRVCTLIANFFVDSWAVRSAFFRFDFPGMSAKQAAEIFCRSRRAEYDQVYMYYAASVEELGYEGDIYRISNTGPLKPIVLLPFNFICRVRVEHSPR